METMFLWKSFPKPYKKIIVKGLKLQKTIWNIRPIKKSSIGILRLMKEYRTHIRTKPLVPKIEKLLQSEVTGTIIHIIFGDDPYVYLQSSMSFNILTIRILFQSMMRDMYIIRLVDTVINMQHALIGLDRFVHNYMPLIITIIHVMQK